MGICIIIPAFNAAATIRDVVAETLYSGLPVLVVNDGSTDSTTDALKGLEVEIVAHPSNLGKGAALRTGFQWALSHGFDGVVTLDADGQHDPSAIPLLVKTAGNGADLVLGSRFARFDEMAGLRRHWNRFGAWCMEKRTGFDISDSQSGFRYYSGRLLRSVELSSSGYELEMEILLKTWRAGFRIASVPVPPRIADGRATSHFRPVRDTWNICMTFLRFM
ncbi:MAG: glycosyltransferase family 2 protein [Geobacter sp.]|nr:glycosyltransferase family 2 protein [Geobacter sp.]